MTSMKDPLSNYSSVIMTQIKEIKANFQKDSY